MLLPFLLSIIIFLVFYSSANDLPVLGDGTYHMFVMEEIADKGSVDIDVMVHYPMFYHLYGGLTSLFFGIPGIKLLSPIMTALSGLVVYLIALKLTSSKPVGLAAMLLIASSAKLVQYNAQILMEPFLIFFVLLAIYSALLFYKNPSTIMALFCSLSVTMAICTKQQALFLLLALPAFFIVNRMPLKRTLLFLALAIVFASGPYMCLHSSIGGLDIPSSTGSIFHRILTPAPDKDSFLNHIAIQPSVDDVPDWSRQLDQEADAPSLHEQGTRDAESRHVYIWDMVNPIKFLDLNSLQPYLSIVHGFRGSTPLFLRTLGYLSLQILLITGLFFSLGYSIGNRKWRIVPAVILFSWLFMFWGSDTQRYFLYLPVFMAFLCPWPLHLVSENFEMSRHKIASLFLILLTCVIALYLVQAAVGEHSDVRELADTQCYHPSEGGIASIEEVGRWIKEDSGEGDRIFGTSIYEWTYYTDREVWHDYRIYYLSKERIDYYLRETWNIKYIIVRENQIIEDTFWNHLEYYPESFYNQIKELYSPATYISECNDIEVYEISG